MYHINELFCHNCHVLCMSTTPFFHIIIKSVQNIWLFIFITRILRFRHNVLHFPMLGQYIWQDLTCNLKLWVLRISGCSWCSFSHYTDIMQTCKIIPDVCHSMNSFNTFMVKPICSKKVLLVFRLIDSAFRTMLSAKIGLFQRWWQ